MSTVLGRHIVKELWRYNTSSTLEAFQRRHDQFHERKKRVHDLLELKKAMQSKNEEERKAAEEKLNEMFSKTGLDRSAKNKTIS
jgi:hypothetical protein